MAEELQNLIDKIQKDGVDKAEERARDIVKEAEQKASAIVRKAEEDADARRKQAEQDADSFRDRGEQALKQAARDVLLATGQALDQLMISVVSGEVEGAMSGDGLKDLLVEAIQAYFKSPEGKLDLTALVGDDRKKDVEAWFAKTFAEKVKKGLEVKADASVVSGFRLSVKDSQVQHDFSREAIAEMLARLLRPRLAAIVKDAAAKMSG